MNTDRMAEANLGPTGSPTAPGPISIETEDNGDPTTSPGALGSCPASSGCTTTGANVPDDPEAALQRADRLGRQGLRLPHNVRRAESMDPVQKTLPRGRPVRVKQWTDILLPALVFNPTDLRDFHFREWVPNTDLGSSVNHRLEQAPYRILKGQDSVYDTSTQPDNEPQENVRLRSSAASTDPRWSRSSVPGCDQTDERTDLPWSGRTG
jgi:hypothetical protein